MVGCQAEAWHGRLRLADVGVPPATEKHRRTMGMVHVVHPTWRALGELWEGGPGLVPLWRTEASQGSNFVVLVRNNRRRSPA